MNRLKKTITTEKAIALLSIIVSALLLYSAITPIEKGFYSDLYFSAETKFFLILITSFFLITTLFLHILTIYIKTKKAKSDILGISIMSCILGLQFYSILNQLLILLNEHNILIRYHYLILTPRFQMIAYVTLGLSTLLLFYYQFLSKRTKSIFHHPIIHIAILFVFMIAGSFVSMSESEKKIPIYLSKDITVNPYKSSTANGYGTISLKFSDKLYERLSGNNISVMGKLDIDYFVLSVEPINGENNNLKNGDKFSYKIKVNQNVKSVFDIYGEDEIYTYEVSGLKTYYYDKETLLSQYDYNQIKNKAIEKVGKMGY